jgi:hypothetical protein
MASSGTDNQRAILPDSGIDAPASPPMGVVPALAAEPERPRSRLIPLKALATDAETLFAGRRTTGTEATSSARGSSVTRPHAGSDVTTTGSNP